jgi:hypothetical protein
VVEAHRPFDRFLAHRAHPLTSPPRTLRRDRHSTYHRGAHGSVRCRWAGHAARARARGRTCPGGAPRCRAARRRNRRDRGRCRNWQVAAARDGGCTGLRPRVPRAERASDRAGAEVPIRSRPPAVRAPADGGRQCRPRPLAVGRRGAGSGGGHRSANHRADGAVAGPTGRRPQLRVAARVVLARLEPLSRFATRARGRRLPVVRRPIGTRAGVHRPNAWWTAPRSDPRDAAVGSRVDTGGGHAPGRSRSGVAATAAADARSGRPARRGSSARRARPGVRARVPRGDGRKPVPLRGTAGRGEGSRLRAHRRRRNGGRRACPSRRRQHRAAPPGTSRAVDRRAGPHTQACSAMALW